MKAGIIEELALLSNRLTISSNNHYAGSQSDFEIIQLGRRFHWTLLEEKCKDIYLIFAWMYSKRIRTIARMVADYDYEIFRQVLRTVRSIKKRSHGVLSIMAQPFNQRAFSDRMEMANFSDISCDYCYCLSLNGTELKIGRRLLSCKYCAHIRQH